MNSITERRSRFVYEAARIAAEAANAPIIPEPWDYREEPFKVQFRHCISIQCSDERCTDPRELHERWKSAYFDMGWAFGPERDVLRKTHPDLVSYDDLGQLERDKDGVFVVLCEIAWEFIRD